MKAIKITTLAVTLAVSTISYAKNSEELCHNVAESDVVIKKSLQKDPSSFAGFLRYIDEAEKNPKIKAALREKAFWVYNRRNLTDEEFTRLSVIWCLSQ